MASQAATISVVIPCYNGLPYLPQALDSALAQTWRPTQIIVVDDGSKDASAQTVRDYAAKYPDRGLELARQANAGEPAARNAGIALAKGEWVAMLDTDDWWEPTKLAKQLDAAEAMAAACPAPPGGNLPLEQRWGDGVMVHTGVVGHWPDGRVVPASLEAGQQRTGRCTAALLEAGSIGHPSIMVRRDALESIGGYDASFRQACDIDLYFRLSAVGSFAFVPEPLLHYRYHDKQMSVSQMAQIQAHHLAISRFFENHPEHRSQIGPDRIAAAMANHVAIKLESLYWRRRLGEFRELLRYAREKGIDSPGVSHWRGKARWPDWAIRLKDRFGAAAEGKGARSWN